MSKYDKCEFKRVDKGGKHFSAYCRKVFEAKEEYDRKTLKKVKGYSIKKKSGKLKPVLLKSPKKKR